MRRFSVPLALAAVVCSPRATLAHPDAFHVLSMPLRVSVPALGGRPVVGSGLVRGDTLRFVREGTTDSLAIPLSSVERLEISRGTRARAGHGAAMGLLIGAGVGGAFGLLSGGESFFGPGGSAVIGAVVFGVAGSGIGAFAGAFQRVPRWEPIDAVQLRVGCDAERAARLEARLAVRF